MNSGKIVADGWTGRNIEGSTRGPRGPKNPYMQDSFFSFDIRCWDQKGRARDWLGTEQVEQGGHNG